MPDFLNDADYLLHSLMENISDNIYFKDAQCRFILVNHAFCDWTGLPMEDIIGKSDFDLFADAHAQQTFEDEQHIIETGEPLLDAEEKETWPDGRITWVSSNKMPLRNDRGEIIGTFGISRDITDHKEAELRAAYYDEQVRTIKERMEDDVRVASELQQTFFPHSCPFFLAAGEESGPAVHFHHHYRASGIVSGDFCSIRKLSDTEAGIFLCDVMGHGVRAALVTALICAIIEDISPLGRDPGVYLGRMNELLLPILQQEDMFLYATACYMVIDLSTGVVRYANAGHPVPLLFSSGGEPAQWLMEDPSLRGAALAVVEGFEYQTLVKTIRPGDSVVLYTDGLYEVESPEGEEFGEERLLEAASQVGNRPLEELYSGLLDSAGTFAGEGGFHDDVCLVGCTFLRSMKGEVQ